MEDPSLKNGPAKELTAYQKWAARHSLVFGFFSDAQMRMVLAWEELLFASGYTPDDLHRATEFLAAKPPAGPWDHLREIQAAIREFKAVDYREEAERNVRGTCGVCGSSGRVVVPHPRGVVDGEWVPVKTSRLGGAYYTIAVFCTCALGRWLASRQGTDRKGEPRLFIRLEQYERSNPHWRKQLEHRRQLRAEAERLSPRSTSRVLDVWWRRLVGHLIKKYQIRP